MEKTKNERLPNKGLEKPHESSGKISPEEDFSPLGGGYQPRQRLSGDFIIPPGESKAITAQANANSSGKAPGSRDEEDERERAKTSSNEP